MSRSAVVDVDAAAPRDRERVDIELVAVEDARVEHRGEQVVRRADRMDVAGEVEVHVLHRHDLRVAGAGRAALDAEDGAERRLTQTEDGGAADVPEPLRERDRGRRLALAGLRRCDGRDVDQLRVVAIGEPLEHGEVDLRLVAAVRLDLVGEEPRRLRDLGDGPELRLLGDLQRRRHVGGHLSAPWRCDLREEYD